MKTASFLACVFLALCTSLHAQTSTAEYDRQRAAREASKNEALRIYPTANDENSLLGAEISKLFAEISGDPKHPDRPRFAQDDGPKWLTERAAANVQERLMRTLGLSEAQALAAVKGNSPAATSGPPAPAPAAAPQPYVQMPVPTLNARSGLVAKQTVRRESGATKTAQEVRTISVDVEVGFFSAPPMPYEIQCFFVSQDEITKKLSIFHADAMTARVARMSTGFTSEPLNGTKKKWTTVPFEGSYTATTSGGGMVSGTVTGSTQTTSQTAGKKFYGWLVRVVSQGRVLKMDSNYPALLTLAQEKVEAFDKVAAQIDRSEN